MSPQLHEGLRKEMTLRYDHLWEAYDIAFKRASSEGRLKDAEKILLYAFDDAEDFSEIDPRLVWATHSLASTFIFHANDKDTASRLYRRLLELREKVLGVEHPDVADSLEKVAVAQLNSKEVRIA